MRKSNILAIVMLSVLVIYNVVLTVRNGSTWATTLPIIMGSGAIVMNIVSGRQRDD